MNKELHDLNKLYEALMKRPEMISTYFPKVYKQRVKTYETFKSKPTSFDENEIIYENSYFSDLIGNILKDTRLDNETYMQYLKRGLRAYTHAKGLVSDNTLGMIIDNENEMFGNVLYSIKSKPQKAGIKIKYVKTALKDLKNIKENLFQTDSTAESPSENNSTANDFEENSPHSATECQFIEQDDCMGE